MCSSCVGFRSWLRSHYKQIAAGPGWKRAETTPSEQPRHVLFCILSWLLWFHICLNNLIWWNTPFYRTTAPNEPGLNIPGVSSPSPTPESKTTNFWHGFSFYRWVDHCSFTGILLHMQRLSNPSATLRLTYISYQWQIKWTSDEYLIRHRCRLHNLEMAPDVTLAGPACGNEWQIIRRSHVI